MKTKLHVQLLALVLPALLSTLSPQLSAVFAQGTAFIYQGRLNENGSPYTGSAEVQPTLWDAVANGTQLATNNPASTVVIVTDGLFVLPLDFGNHFSGADRWLQLEVRTTLGPFTTLTPRQQLTPTPYAIYSASALTARGVGTNSITVTQLLTPGAPAPGQVLAYDGNGFVWTNPPTSSPGWALTGNSDTSPTNGNFIGTTDNQPLEVKVNSLRVVRWERQTNTLAFSSVSPNLIGGFEGNTIAAGVSGATIAGGGGTNWYGPTVPHGVGTNGSFSTIGGGVGNVIESPVSTIAGGERGTITLNAYNSFLGGGAWNTIDSPDSTIGGGRYNLVQSNGYAATIAGGYQNTIRTNSYYSTIGGGYLNTIQGNVNNSTIGGGYANTNSGFYATVPGGYLNWAAGDYSFAAGNGARASHSGSFVWADASSFGAAFASTAANQFNVRANGGARFVTGGTGLSVDGVNVALLGGNQTFSGAFTSFGDIGLDNGTAPYHRLQLSGGNSTGFLFGSYPYFLDGVHLTYNFYADANGGGHVINAGGGSSRITAAYGEVVLAVGDPGFGPNTVRLRANSGGVTVYGTFNNSSDRNAKQDFASISPSQILEKVAQLPLSEWSYKEDPSTRHVGPMGQDFYSAFNIGTDEKHIAPIDEGGVALAAIQGLNEKIESERQKGEDRMQKLETQNAELKRELAALKELIFLRAPGTAGANENKQTPTQP